MTVLLDTHVWWWWITGERRLTFVHCHHECRDGRDLGEICCHLARGL